MQKDKYDTADKWNLKKTIQMNLFTKQKHTENELTVIRGKE